LRILARKASRRSFPAIITTKPLYAYDGCGYARLAHRWYPYKRIGIMARAAQSEQYAISLFPMFNILICTLGVLIFILGALATLALGVGRTVLLNVGEKASEVSVTTAVHLKTPHFIEWDGSSLIAHPEKQSAQFDQDIRSIDTFEQTYEYMQQAISGTPLESLLQQIGESKGRDYVVLLVRPSGFPSLYEVRGFIESRGIALGYEPIMQGWNVRVPE